MYISEELKAFRKKNNLDRATLASYLGVSYESVGRWERGESISNLALEKLVKKGVIGNVHRNPEGSSDVPEQQEPS